MQTERTFTRTARIARPPEEVWAFMTNLANAGRWIQGVDESKQVSPGPMAVGAIIRETRTLGGRTESFDIDVREFDPPRRYAAGVKFGKAEFVYTYELAGTGAKTEVAMRAVAQGSGIGTRLFIGVGMRMMEKHDGTQLERLKAAVEATPRG